MKKIPAIFIGSSKEAIKIVNAIENRLHKTEELKVYNWQNEFSLSNYFLPELLEKLNLNKYDYGVFILSPNDMLTIRGKKQLSARDNVLLEAGIFIGKIGLKRVFLLKPDGVSMRIPSDIFGLNIGGYDASCDNFQEMVAPFCAELIQAIDMIENEAINTNNLNVLSDQVEQIVCKTHIRVLNDQGDCVFSEAYRIKSSSLPIYEKHIEIYGSERMGFDDLKLRANGKKGKPLHIDGDKKREPTHSRRFIIRVPIEKKVGEFSYSYIWNKLFPTDNESFTLMLHALENEFILEYPINWVVKYFKIMDTMDNNKIVTPESIDEKINKAKNIKVCRINFGRKNARKRLSIEWQR